MKEVKSLLMIARSLVASETVLALNSSGWSWEDDSNHVDANVLVDDRGNLQLVITETHIKSGLGAGKRVAERANVSIGTLTSPKLGMVPTLLKKYGHERTRSGWPFQRTWIVPETKEKLPLSEILIREATKRAALEGPSISVAPMVSPQERKEALMEKIQRMSPEEVEKMLSMIGR